VDALIKLANRALHAEPAVRREVGPVQQKSADARSGPAAKWSSTEGWSLPVDRGK
jgi:hypothetical protein